MAHDVEIDAEEVGRVFGGYADHGGPPPVEGDHIPSGGSQQEQPRNWQRPAEFAAGFLNAKICPNWEVDSETQQEWANALADCLEQLFPGGLGHIDQWSPWAKLAYATGAWCVCGINPQTMTFKPLHPQPPEEEGDDNAPPAASRDGKFTTEAGE